MNRLFGFLMLMLCVTAVAFSASKKDDKPKEVKMSVLYKNASNALKNNGGQEQAEQALLGALNRQGLGLKERAKIYYTSALLQESVNGVENRKAYLKQQYDSARFFNTLLSMYERLRLCDSIDAVPMQNGRVLLKYKRKTHELRRKHRDNILNGGKFYLSKNNYAQAYDFLDHYISYAHNEKNFIADPKVTYWAAVCGFHIGDPQKTLKYIDRALDAGTATTRPILQEYKSISYLKLQNDSAWFSALQEGVREFPGHDYFFVNLEDYYYARRMFTEGHALADSLICIDAGKSIYWYAKSKLELAENDYEKCIAYSDSVIQRDDKFTDAYYNKGLSFLNLALIVQESACTDMSDPKCMYDREKILAFYQAAKPCMEMVRRLEPENTQRWGSPLYRIYLNLNMEKEFNEIDELLHKSA